MSPRTTVREFLGPVVIDAGWDAEACSKATMQALAKVCRVETGRRVAGRHDLTGEGDYIDEMLLNHLKSVIVAGTSDGAPVELQGIHRLKEIGALPALRYQFRDKAHVTRCVLKGTLKHAGRGKEMMEALIRCPNAFAKKVRRSRRFKQLWVEAQQTDGQDDIAVISQLSHGEHRFDSRSRPM